MNKKIASVSLLALLFFTGCGEVKPTLSDAVKGSFKIHSGMTMDEVSKTMKIEPTAQEKIGDTIMWKYEGNVKKGEDDNVKIVYNNIIIKFSKGKVSYSGTFSCDLPKRTDED